MHVVIVTALLVWLRREEGRRRGRWDCGSTWESRLSWIVRCVVQRSREVIFVGRREGEGRERGGGWMEGDIIIIYSRTSLI